MKQCPKFQSCFGDEGLNFCRFDGVQLVGELAGCDEAPTLMFLKTPNETDTRETRITGPLIRS